jgi:hypothetical protein
MEHPQRVGNSVARAEMTCKDCRYALRAMDDRYLCRRYPPLGEYFPIVAGKDWCGELVRGYTKKGE